MNADHSTRPDTFPLPVMSHFVAMYPDRERSLAVARGLVEAGAKYLEVQFPFSDPSADGPAIQVACQASLEAGFTLERGWAFLRELTRHTDVPVFVMTYAAVAVSHGTERFAARAGAAGATGVIIPDLPVDDDEGMLAACEREGLSFVPVFPVTVAPDRLATILERTWDYLYVSLRSGITGQQTKLTSPTIAFLKDLSRTGSRILAGFGIRSRDQVEQIVPYVDAAIVGSALVRAVQGVVRGSADDPVVAGSAETSSRSDDEAGSADRWARQSDEAGSADTGSGRGDATNGDLPDPEVFQHVAATALSELTGSELTGVGKSSYVTSSWK